MLFFQPASDKTDVPRFKKIIAAAQKAGKAKKFSKKETQAIAAKLAESMDEEDLGIDDEYVRKKKKDVSIWIGIWI